MPGFIVDVSTKMTCPHGGTVMFLPAGPPAVVLNGSAVVTSADQMVVIGCLATPKCAKVQWSNTGRVSINGKPVLLQTPPIPMSPGNGVCVGSAPPNPVVLATQPFVSGT